VIQARHDPIAALDTTAVDALAGELALGAASLVTRRARSDCRLAGRINGAEQAAQVCSHRFQEHEGLIDRANLGAEDAAAAGTPLAEDDVLDVYDLILILGAGTPGDVGGGFGAHRGESFHAAYI
jgi:hypothetical protein